MAQLKSLHTGTLMRLRKECHKASGGWSYSNTNQVYTIDAGFEFTPQEIKAVLDTREHIPNKADRKKARQLAAKQRR